MKKVLYSILFIVLFMALSTGVMHADALMRDVEGLYSQSEIIFADYKGIIPRVDSESFFPML